MPPIRILIVDDSSVFRAQIRAALDDTAKYEIVATASNGRMALEKLAQSPVDLVTLDLEMPELDGLGTLRAMRERSVSAKTIVFSSVSKSGAEIALEALKLGAVDFVAKPSFDAAGAAWKMSPQQLVRDLLTPKINSLFPNSALSTPAPVPVAPTRISPALLNQFRPKAIVIGSSTGGPNALEELFREIESAPDCPIFVTQHMPPVFTSVLAERLGKLHGIASGEGKDNETVVANRIYVAPGDYHMRLARAENSVRIILDKGPQLHSVRPAVDPLFESAAEIYGHGLLGIVLTGMGEDGRAGAVAVKEKHGVVLIQNKESCVVFGMPGAVFAAGAYDRAGSPREIGSWVSRWITRGEERKGA